MALKCKSAYSMNFSWNVVLIAVVLQCGLTWSMQRQTHRGSAPTNDFTLTENDPDAKIQIDSSSAIIIINVNPPASQKDNPYKVSLELLAMHLCDPGQDDRLKVVYSDPTTIRTNTWKVNVSFPSVVDSSSSSEHDLELKDIQANQIVLIPEGRWVLSKADLVATLYQDSSADGKCPPNMISCACASNLTPSVESSAITRCIPKKLQCNENRNCGFGCETDESESGCPRSSSFISSTTPCKVTTSTTTIRTTQSELGNSDGGGSKLMSFNFVLLSIVAYIVR